MARLAIDEGTPVRVTPYPAWPGDLMTRRTSPPSPMWCAAASGAGARTRVNGGTFEEAFAAYQGAGAGMLMMNGTVTMEAACKALGIGWGDEVIVPAFTFAATATRRWRRGGAGVRRRHAGDVDVDPEHIEAAITERTRAMIPVHLGHRMADIDRIMEIAKGTDSR